jgi:polyisoprenoid-binding protein YceI
LSGVPAGTWVLDPAASRFEFQVKHFWGLMTVQGYFQQAEGQAEVDASGSVSATLRIDAASIESKQKQRDKHLRSADFFHVEQHPNVTFSTKKVSVLAADRLQVEGELTAAGHSEPVAFEAHLTPSGDTVVVDAQVRVDRTLFGMTWSPMGMASSTALLVARAQFSRQRDA